MKKIVLQSVQRALAAAGLFSSLLALQAQAQDLKVAPSYVDRKADISYAVGVTTARNLQKDGVDIDPELVLQGMKDALAGKPGRLSDTEIKALMNSLVTDMRQRFVANRRNVEEGNRKRGDDFRSAFAKEAGVRVMPDGVLIKELRAGSGPVPTARDAVEVRYVGTLVDGKEFDASPKDQSVTFELAKLIPGWREALLLMPQGARWKLVIPADLAYGVRGIGTDIGPNETLVFDLELVRVIPAR